MPQASKCKPDRNRKNPQNSRYKAENRHGKSHMRRIKLHLARYGGAYKIASEALVRYAGSVGSNALSSAKEYVKGL